MPCLSNFFHFSTGPIFIIFIRINIFLVIWKKYLLVHIYETIDLNVLCYFYIVEIIELLKLNFSYQPLFVSVTFVLYKFICQSFHWDPHWVREKKYIQSWNQIVCSYFDWLQDLKSSPDSVGIENLDKSGFWMIYIWLLTMYSVFRPCLKSWFNS